MGRTNTNLAEPPPEKYNEEARCRNWSAGKLREDGFTPEQTEELLDLRVDYRYARQLVVAGCEHELVLRIIR